MKAKPVTHILCYIGWPALICAAIKFHLTMWSTLIGIPPKEDLFKTYILTLFHEPRTSLRKCIPLQTIDSVNSLKYHFSFTRIVQWGDDIYVYFLYNNDILCSEPILLLPCIWFDLYQGGWWELQVPRRHGSPVDRCLGRGWSPSTHTGQWWWQSDCLPGGTCGTCHLYYHFKCIYIRVCVVAGKKFSFS